MLIHDDKCDKLSKSIFVLKIWYQLQNHYNDYSRKGKQYKKCFLFPRKNPVTCCFLGQLIQTGVFHILCDVKNAHTINVIDEMQKVTANLTHCYPAFKLIHVFPNLKFQIRSLRYLPKIDSFMIPQDSRLRRVTNVSHQDYISLLYQNSWLPPKQELAVVFTTPSQAEYQFGTKILQSDCSKQSPYC